MAKKYAGKPAGGKSVAAKFGTKAAATPRCPITGVLLNPRSHVIVLDVVGTKDKVVSTTALRVHPGFHPV